MAKRRDRGEPKAPSEEAKSRATLDDGGRSGRSGATQNADSPFAFVLESPGEQSKGPENAVRPAKRRAAAKNAIARDESEVSKDSASGRSKGTKPKPRDASAAVPDEVRTRFVQVGRVFYFPDGARAFTDRGQRLTTPSENTEVIRSLVAIARARQWNEIVVSGTDRFRREAWMAAQKSGLEVRGYKPTEFEQARVARAVARDVHRAEHPPSNASDRVATTTERPQRAKAARDEGLIRGTLIEHGRAPYRDEPKAPMSYFVKVETGKGERTIWGIDLERAFRESLTQPKVGDAVALRTVRRDPVTVKAAIRDEQGAVIGDKEVARHRNRWIVEKQPFFEERAAAAKVFRDVEIDPKHGSRQHPELVGSYLQLKGAEEVAARRIRDPQDQQRFVALVREALAASIGRGEPLAPVRLNQQQTRPQLNKMGVRAEREMVLGRE